MNKKPPELHLVDGTKPRGAEAVSLPASIRKRIPKAEWLDNPEKWDRNAFMEETANFLHTVYGIGNDVDKHSLSMLATHIETYVRCWEGMKKTGVITTFNNGQTVGPSPYLSAMNKATTYIIQLMNELGLTPRSRLSAGKIEEDSPVAKFLKGPFAS
jgi:P27 family predicted phage terminase small subunit